MGNCPVTYITEKGEYRIEDENAVALIQEIREAKDVLHKRHNHAIKFLKLIVEAKSQGFGIDYAEGCARTALIALEAAHDL